jgi:hypothetical protein
MAKGASSGGFKVKGAVAPPFPKGIQGKESKTPKMKSGGKK